MRTDREKFPNPPLVLAAAEVRFPYAPRLKHQETWDRLAEELRTVVPVLRKEQQATITLGPDGASVPSVETSLRLLDKASTSSLAFFPDRLVVESTDYVDFATFQELTRRGVEAIDKLGGPVAVERIGLRYINEIRVPGRIADTRDWTEWVAPALVGIGEVAGAWPVTTLQGVLQYKVGTDRHLIFRYAALPDGSVIGDAPLRRTRAGSGPVFVVDLDCFWQPADGQLPDFVADQVMECVTELHEPIEEAFLYVITERLKDEVLRKEAR